MSHCCGLPGRNRHSEHDVLWGTAFTPFQSDTSSTLIIFDPFPKKNEYHLTILKLFGCKNWQNLCCSTRRLLVSGACLRVKTRGGGITQLAKTDCRPLNRSNSQLAYWKECYKMLLVRDSCYSVPPVNMAVTDCGGNEGKHRRKTAGTTALGHNHPPPLPCRNLMIRT